MKKKGLQRQTPWTLISTYLTMLKRCYFISDFYSEKNKMHFILHDKNKQTKIYRIITKSYSFIPFSEVCTFSGTAQVQQSRKNMIFP